MKDDRKLLYISDYTEDLIFANSQDIANKLSLKKKKIYNWEKYDDNWYIINIDIVYIDEER